MSDQTRDQKATCESHGHIYGVGGRCVFCRTHRAEDVEPRDGASDVQTIATLRAEVERLINEREACAEFLRAGETPAECIARNRADTNAVLSLLAAEKDENARLKAELDMLREHNSRMLRNRYEETNQELRSRIAELEATLAAVKDAWEQERQMVADLATQQAGDMPGCAKEPQQP